MRLFVALELSRNSVEAIENWRTPLKKEFPLLRWTPANQLHVTLRFLGERNPEEVVQKLRTLELNRLLPVKYSFTETGTFGRPPSVAWLSGRFSGSVFKMADRLCALPDGDGRTCRGGSFKLHVTVARLKKGVKYPGLVFKESITGTSETVNLVSSRLTPSGPVYSTVYTVSN